MVDKILGRGDIILKPDGTRITRTSLLNDAINYYQEAYQNRWTEVCDFSEGSEIRTLHESFLVELFSLYKEMYRNAKMKFVLDSKGTYLDRLGCEFHLTRGVAKHATGSVTFSVKETFGKPVVIERGTRILHKDYGYEYILTEDVTITSSATPTNGLVESVLAGSMYNCRSHKLTTFQDISSVHRMVSVTNNSPITGGVDEESDNDFRNRILRAKRAKSWGTATTYGNDIREYVSADDDSEIYNLYHNSVGLDGVFIEGGVHDVQFIDPKELKADPNLPPHYKSGTDWESIQDKEFSVRQNYYCTDCTRVCFVNGTMKVWYNDMISACSPKLLEAVQYYIEQQDNVVIGHNFHVQAAEVDVVYLGMNLFVSSSVSEDTIYNHLTAFFSGGGVEGQSGTSYYPGLNINESVSKNTLLDVLENVPGVHQVASLHLLKYNPDLNVRDYAWVDHGDNTYTYTDEDGFTFTRKTVAPDIINYWGWTNFTEIECGPGTVLVCGNMSDIDSKTDKVFDISSQII